MGLVIKTGKPCSSASDQFLATPVKLQNAAMVRHDYLLKPPGDKVDESISAEFLDFLLGVWRFPSEGS